MTGIREPDPWPEDWMDRPCRACSHPYRRHPKFLVSERGQRVAECLDCDCKLTNT